MYKLTSFTHHTTGEGERVSYTYSEIDDDGNVTKSNQRASTVVLDEDILKAVAAINNFLTDKLARK